MTDYEQIVRALLRGRVCMCGVAVDSDESYRILAADLERLMACDACGDSALDHGGWYHRFEPRRRDRDPCPYTHAHTRHWCGHPDCRES